MGILTQVAEVIFAPFGAGGQARAIDPADVQVWGTEIERIINAFVAQGGRIYASKADMLDDLAWQAGTMAWVLGDPVGDNNGIWRKVGAINTGTWTKAGDLPFSFIPGVDAGAGTPNAIKITTPIPAAQNLIVAFTLAQDTTGSPVTVSINGGAPITLKTNRGSNVNALTAGMDIWFRIRGSEGRLLNDQDAAALVGQMESLFDQTQTVLDTAVTTLTDATQEMRDDAQSAATDAQMYATIVGAAAFDFSFDSDPETPGYDWSE